jgi:hypothetical protein
MIAPGGEMANISDANRFDFVMAIPSQFAEYIDVALLRLQGLNPRCRFARIESSVAVQLPADLSEEQIRGLIAHTVYREKIYAETLSMRTSLVAAVME